MPYDEGLAERVREVLDERRGISEKKMFGGLAFLVAGKMGVGVVREELMVRVGPDAYEAALRRHARQMDFTGRPMKGFVFVASEGLGSDTDLRRWVELGLRGAESSQAPRARTKGSRASK
jgi:TfoX/Sxy family transcriptional regulator of competence genes